MPYECKFGFQSGNFLAFTAFQPSGIGRGLAHQFMLEVVNHGYYRATPVISLVVGDMVLVYKQEKVLYESAGVLYLDYEYVFWEDEYIAHDGEYIRDLDTESNQKVFWTEEPVGVGEYESAVDISTSITNITNNQTDVYNTYNERDGDGVGVGAGVESEIITDC